MSKRSVACAFYTLTLFTLLIFFPIHALAADGEVGLTWDLNDEPNIFGYNLYFGTQSGNYNAPGSPLFVAHPINTVTVTGLQGGEEYFFAVTAIEQSGLQSPPSDEISKIISGSTPDTTPPSTPVIQSAVTTSSTQATITWAAATDNVGVTGYTLYRDNTPVTTTPNLTFSDATLSPSTTYAYTVMAHDAEDNNSDPSTAASITTPAAPDTTPPSTPVMQSAVADSSTQATITWAASTDNVGVTGYTLYRDNTPVTTTADTLYADQNLTPENSYVYTVRAQDAADNESSFSAEVTVTTPADEEPPAPVSTKLAQGVINDVANTGWTPVTLEQTYSSMVVVATVQTSAGQPSLVPRIRNASGNSFEVRVDRADGLTTPITNATVHYMSVEEGTFTQAEHGVKLEAVKFVSTSTDSNTAWNGQARSYANTYSNPVVLGQVMTYNDPEFSVFWARGSSRTSPPSATTLFVGKHVGEDSDKTRANETIGYIVLEEGAGIIGTTNYVAGISSDIVKGIDNSPPFNYNFNGLSSTGTAIVSAAAMDGGNGGWPVLYGPEPLTSNSLSLAFEEDQIKDTERKHTTEQVAFLVFEETNGATDTTPPSVTSITSAVANSSTQATITWAAATDNVGVTGYTLYRDNNPITTTPNLAFSDSTLSPSTTYSYTVMAHDAEDNNSDPSTAASVTTPASADTTPPSTPVIQSAVADSVTQATITWAAATDNVGVTGYTLYRDNNPITTTPNLTFSDSTLSPSTTYSYTVMAHDAEDNNSDPSTAASVTTPTPEETILLDVRVASGSDDAEEQANGGMGLYSSDLELVSEATNQTVGIRFTDLTIPQGATIVNAWVQFQVDETSSTTTSLTIQGEATDQASSFGWDTGDISTRNHTAASVNWSPAPWTSVGAAGPDQQTPNLAPVIQEIVNRSGWGSGHAIALLITGTGKRVAESHNGNSSAAPLLHVEYQTGGAPPVDTTPPSVTSITSAVVNSSTQATLTWTAATDNVGVTGYHVYRDGNLLATTPGLNYVDSGLNPSTTYVYAVQALDAAGNVAALSPSSSVTTEDQTLPGNGTAQLSWMKNEENDLSHYVVQYGTASQVYTMTIIVPLTENPSYTVTGLAPWTYYFTVRAVDQAGNAGPPAPEATKTIAN